MHSYQEGFALFYMQHFLEKKKVLGWRCAKDFKNSVSKINLAYSFLIRGSAIKQKKDGMKVSLTRVCSYILRI
jgi:hypothetical protein